MHREVQYQAEKIRKMPSGRYRYKTLLSSWREKRPKNSQEKFADEFAEKSAGNFPKIRQTRTQEVLNPTHLNPTPATCGMPQARSEVALQFSECCAAEVALQHSLFCSGGHFRQKLCCSKRKLQCSIVKKLLCRKVALSCRLPADFRLPCLGPADFGVPLLSTPNPLCRAPGSDISKDSKLKNLLMPLGCFQRIFKRDNGPLRHSGTRPIKVGKRPIKEGKRPTL